MEVANNENKNSINVSTKPPSPRDSRLKDNQTHPEPSPTFHPNQAAKDSNNESPESAVQEESEEEEEVPVRLFIGQVPETMLEKEITELFQSKGIKLLDISIIRDKATGRHRHCCFVTVCSRPKADCAIDEFHNKRYLKNMSNPMQVREANQPKSKATFAAMRAFSQMMGTAMPTFAVAEVKSSEKQQQQQPFFVDRIASAPNLGSQHSHHQHPHPMMIPHPHPAFYQHASNAAAYPWAAFGYPQQQQQQQQKKGNEMQWMPDMSKMAIQNCFTEENLNGTVYYHHPQTIPLPIPFPIHNNNNSNPTFYSNHQNQNHQMPMQSSGCALSVKELPERFCQEDLFKLFAPFGKILHFEYNAETKIGQICFSSVQEAFQAIKKLDGSSVQDSNIVVELNC